VCLDFTNENENENVINKRIEANTTLATTTDICKCDKKKAHKITIDIMLFDAHNAGNPIPSSGQILLKWSQLPITPSLFAHS